MRHESYSVTCGESKKVLRPTFSRAENFAEYVPGSDLLLGRQFSLHKDGRAVKKTRSSGGSSNGIARLTKQREPHSLRKPFHSSLHYENHTAAEDPAYKKNTSKETRGSRRTKSITCENRITCEVKNPQCRRMNARRSKKMTNGLKSLVSCSPPENSASCAQRLPVRIGCALKAQPVLQLERESGA